jgi:hypothetical protein
MKVEKEDIELLETINEVPDDQWDDGVLEGLSSLINRMKADLEPTEYTADEMIAPSPKGMTKEFIVPYPREQCHPSRMDYFVGKILSNNAITMYDDTNKGNVEAAISIAKEAIKQIDKL